MALLSPSVSALTGVVLAPAAATASTGDTFANTGKEMLYVKNGSGSSINVTIDAPATCDFNVGANAAHDQVVAVAAGVEKLIGPFPVARFNAAGLVTVICSAVTTVTVAVIAPAS